MLPIGSIRATTLMVLTAALMFAGGLAQAKSCSMARVNGTDRMIAPENGINQALIDAAILAEMNFYRCQSGLKPLDSNTSMQRIALTHAQWMAKTQTISHKSQVPGQGTLRARISTSGMKVRVGSENVGMVHRYQIDGNSFRITSGKGCVFVSAGGNTLGPHSYGSLAKKIVTLWMNSSGHRFNIMDRKVRLAGSAVAFSAAAPYCGQYFISQNFVG